MSIEDFKLSQPERALLKSLVEQPGFAVLARMMDAACRRANAKVVECDDDAKVINLQKEARATNAFCDLLRNAINWNVKYANVTTNAQGAALNERDPASGFKPN